MDPHLFDIIWEVYRESGSTQPIDVLSGYRSPQTNAMLRRRSRQVAEHSQHMQGKAIDAHFLDVGTGRIRDIAMRMQAGGVGFYPTGNTPWVHIDSGSVRYWPRMSRDALTRLFPDGKTVFIPADGQPMPGYELARAEIEARGGQVQVASGGGNWRALLLAVRRRRRRRRRGGQAARKRRPRWRRPATRAAVVAAARSRRLRSPMSGRRRSRRPSATCRPAPPTPEPVEPAPAAKPEASDSGPEAVAKAKRNLPTGPAYASAADSAPTPPVKPQTRRGAGTARRRQRRFADEPRRRPARSLRAAAAARPADLVGARARRRSHASDSSGGSDPCLEDRIKAAPLSRRRRTSRSTPPSIAQLVSCRRSSPPASTALRPARWRSPKRRRRGNMTTARCWRGRPNSPRPCRRCRSPMSRRPRRRRRQQRPTAPQPHAGGVAHSAALVAQDIARMFGGLPFGAFKSAAPARRKSRRPARLAAISRR